MGYLVTVWSNTKKVGKTVFLYNFVSELSRIIHREKKILVIDLNFKYGNLLKLFNVKNDLHFEDVINYKHLSEDSIDYKKAITKKDGVYFLDSVMPDMAYAKTNIHRYNDTLIELKQIFDLVMVDLIASHENPLTNLIIQSADYNINLINQDMDNLNRDFKALKDMMYIINLYDKDVYPNEKDIISNFNIDKEVFTLPYCPVLLEMKNREILEQYQGGTDYIDNIKKISEKFLTNLNYIGIKEDERKKKLLGFFGR